MAPTTASAPKWLKGSELNLDSHDSVQFEIEPELLVAVETLWPTTNLDSEHPTSHQSTCFLFGLEKLILKALRRQVVNKSRHGSTPSQPYQESNEIGRASCRERE